MDTCHAGARDTSHMAGVGRAGGRPSQAGRSPRRHPLVPRGSTTRAARGAAGDRITSGLAEQGDGQPGSGRVATSSGHALASSRPYATYVVLAITVAISLFIDYGGPLGNQLGDLLLLDKEAVMNGEYWRLFTVDAGARRAAAPWLQHVRAVHRRARSSRRCTAESSSSPSTCSPRLAGRSPATWSSPTRQSARAAPSSACSG